MPTARRRKSKSDKKVFRSFEEYEKTYYPPASQVEEAVESDDAFLFGTLIADEALRKIRDTKPKRKRSGSRQ